jgi:hypothetical protein
MAFVPNPLGNFNTYAHNIDVTIGPESSKEIDVTELAPGQGVTIASTGKTANFYVDKVTVRNIPTTSNNNISTSVIGIVIEILEPMGFTFFDKYFSSIYSLGWQNATEAMIFVSVSFNGWFENGSASPRSFKNVWKCTVADIKVDVEASASKYTMTLYIVPTESLESQNHIVDRSFTSEIKEKFEDTIKELESTFNRTGSTRDPTNRFGENDRIYEFRVGPRLLEEDPRMPVNLQSGRTSVQLGPDGRPTYVVNSGITITEMLTTLALNITGISRILNPRLDENYTEETDQPLGADIMQYFSVHVEAGYSRFDPVRNRYVRVLRYTIDLAYRPELEHQPINELGKRERAMAYMKYGLLKKRYDYLFTGKNTEVLDLKIDFNAMYQQLLTSYVVQNPQSQAPNMDEENRNRETGQDVVLARSQNFSNILSSIGSFFSGGGITATGRLMETIPGSGILASLLNYTHAPTVSAEQARRGVNVPMDNDHARNVAAGAEVDARANARNAYTEMYPLGMVQMKLGIRGDPYWMGTSFTSRSSTPAAQNSADFYSGTQMFYIKFKLGEPHNERTGLTANLGKVTFNGIYHVTHVLSVFESGKFTQVLDGFIDVGTFGVEF